MSTTLLEGPSRRSHVVTAESTVCFLVITLAFVQGLLFSQNFPLLGRKHCMSSVFLLIQIIVFYSASIPEFFCLPPKHWGFLGFHPLTFLFSLPILPEGLTVTHMLRAHKHSLPNSSYIWLIHRRPIEVTKTTPEFHLCWVSIYSDHSGYQQSGPSLY